MSTPKLTDAVVEIVDVLSAMRHELKAARAKIERLEKAGDELDCALRKGIHRYFHELVNAWTAAKEGE